MPPQTPTTTRRPVSMVSLPEYKSNFGTCGTEYSKRPEASGFGPGVGWAGGETGNVLLSHRAAPAVSLGLEGLTTVLERGSGVEGTMVSPASPHVKETYEKRGMS